MEMFFSSLLLHHLRFLDCEVLDNFSLCSSLTLVVVDYLLQLFHDSSSKCFFCIKSTATLLFDNRAYFDKPIKELLSFLKIVEPLIKLGFLVSSEQENSFVAEVDLHAMVNPIALHFRSA